MKNIFNILFILVFINSGFTISAKSKICFSNIENKLEDKHINRTATISGTITGTTTVCQNAASPVITFTGSGGTAPYTFTYTLTGVTGNQTIQTTGTNSSVTISAPTTTIGTFTYNLISVHDATNPATEQSSPDVEKITVISNFSVTAGTDIFVCKGSTINLTSSVSGNGSNAVAYSWSGPNSYTSNQQSPNISNSTFAMSGIYTVTASVGSCRVSDNINITIPEPQIETLGGTVITSFTKCNVTSGVFTFKLSTPTYQSIVSNYVISWGDTTSETFTSSSGNPSHTYPIGYYTISIQMNLTNGCSVIKTYPVFVGSSPSPATMALFVNQANGCIPHITEFTFNVPSTNVNGTTYVVSWGDGTPDETYIHPVSVSTLKHTYNISSCGKNVVLNGVTYSNAFQPTVITQNPCSTPQPSSSGVIYIGQGPNASFTPSSNNTSVKICTSQPLQLNNTSDFGLTIPTTGATCSKDSPFYWVITPSTAGLWTASGLGTNNGDINDITNWTLGSMTPSVTFNVPGTYTITLRVKNSCGDNSVSQTFCVEPPLAPTFTITTNSGCIPLSVVTNNTTVPINSCSPPVYTWSVSYAASSCGTTSAYTYTNGTSATSASPSFNFTEAGTYTIVLTATNSCSPPQIATKIITVKKPPTVSINPILDICQTLPTTSISPTATITNCGTQVLNYLWSFPGGTPTTSTLAVPGAISYATAGNHIVSLTVTNECSSTIATDKTFTINTTPVLTNPSLTQTICSGSSTALVTLTANPSTATFTWTAIATAGITGFLASGTNTIPIQTISTTSSTSGTVTYSITPTVGSCVGTAVQYVVTINPAPTITPIVSSTVCVGGTPTILSFTISGATGTPSYQWYSNNNITGSGGTLIPGETSAIFNPPSSVSGTFYYYCIITLPSGGCSKITTNTATVVITPLATINLQPIASQSLCVGSTIASPLTITYTGGTGTASYQWYSSTTSSTIGGTPVGGNSLSYLPSIYTLQDDYYYYCVVSLTGNACGTTASSMALVSVFDDPSITLQPITTQTLCQNATPSNLVVTATGGNGAYTYQWYSNTNSATLAGSLIPSATLASYTPPTTSVGTKYYYCIVSQATLGCSVISSIATVIINASPTIQNQPTSSAICIGGTPTALSFTVANGVGTPSYQWYSNLVNSNIGGTLISGETNDTYTPQNSVVGISYYYCQVSFPSLIGNCSTVETAATKVSIESGASINLQPLATQSLCVGSTIPIPLSVGYANGTGTASYQWFSNTTNSTTGGTDLGVNSSTYTPSVFTISGIYYYYVVISFSGSGCGAITSNIAKVDVVQDPVITNQPTSLQIVCQNTPLSPLNVSVTGGIGINYSYQWYRSTLNNSTSGTLISGETNSSFSPPTTIAVTLYYYCLIEQINGTGCNVTSTIATVTVNLAPAFTTTLASSDICLGQSPSKLKVVTNSDSLLPNYQWYSNTNNSNIGGIIILGETNSILNPAAGLSGTTYYYCVVTFPSITGGCSIITTDAVAVIINPYPIITAKNVTICSGAAFTITPANSVADTIPLGTTYIWTNPTYSPVGAIIGAEAKASPQSNISQTLINTTSSPVTVTYTVLPTSGVCVGGPFLITVVVNPAINPNIVVANNTCFGVNNASITTNITGGIPFGSGNPYTLIWTGPNGFNASSTNITNIQPGNYDLTINDAGGCPFSKTYSITEPKDIVIAVDSKNNITCFGSANGSIAINVTGGSGNYIYKWTQNTTPFSTGEDISNLAPGNYVVTVTDVNNCGPKSASFVITQPPILDVNLISQTNVICYGAATGAIVVNSSGGTPIAISPSVFDYSYSWTGPNGFVSTSQNLSNLYAGSYKLAVTDNNGCVKNLIVVLTQTPDIDIAYSTTPITCYGANNASLKVTISGGIGPYQYQWSNLATTLIQTNLSAGNYTIMVTDNLNCIKNSTINIPEAALFTINPIVSNISCFGAHDGSINLNLVGGKSPKNLVWSDGSTSGLIRNNLGSGTYTATISDSTPCYIVRQFTIIEPQPIAASAILTDALDCNDAKSGAINLVVAGGTTPYKYLWSNGEIAEDLNTITSGNYQVTVTDTNGCSTKQQYSILRPTPINIDVTTKTNFNCTTHSVSQNFIANVSGGVPPYQLQWSSGAISGSNDEIMYTDVNGTVILNAIDKSGCTSSRTVLVNIPEIGYNSFDITSYAYASYGLYSILDSIQFNSSLTGDYVSISWDFGDGTFSTELNPTHSYVNPKDYVVTQTVTYPFGCVYVQKITLIVKKGYVLVVPTAFTPNNDNLNDNFRPVTKGLKNIRLDIYDTWGSLIYSETGYDLKGWDGKIKGVNAENGNYYSKISAETFYGIIIHENNPFVLIK